MALNSPWFVVKRYGFGMAPRGWGWLVTLAFLVLVGLAVIVIGPYGRAPTGLAIAALLAVFLVIVMRTGDHKPWRWRSGGDET